ncbi:MAG: hypothetical protein WBA57_11620 [Elainellaceae cyanobacterium]
MNMMTIPHMNGSAKGMEQLWLRSSVEKFFSTINWDDRPLEVKSEASAPELEQSDQAVIPNGVAQLSMALSVKQFFDLFPWEGQPVIAAPLAVETTITDEVTGDDITLDDFSDLF